jgi:hypothetical protein
MCIDPERAKKCVVAYGYHSGPISGRRCGVLLSVNGTCRKKQNNGGTYQAGKRVAGFWLGKTPAF